MGGHFDQQRGMVLIAVLLFLALLTLTVFSLFEANLLTTKTTRYQTNRWRAFTAAETNLQRLLMQPTTGTHQAHWLAQDACSNTYRLGTTAVYQGVTVSVTIVYRLKKKHAAKQCHLPTLSVLSWAT